MSQQQSRILTLLQYYKTSASEQISEGTQEYEFIKCNCIITKDKALSLVRTHIFKCPACGEIRRITKSHIHMETV